MEINQIEQLLQDIEDNAKKVVVQVNGIYILRDDEPKYRALLALKDFLGRNETVIRELNEHAQAAGVAISEIMATFAAPEKARENIQVGVADPVITAPVTNNAKIESSTPFSVDASLVDVSGELKKKSDQVGALSGANVGEPISEEIMPELPTPVHQLSEEEIGRLMAGAGELVAPVPQDETGLNFNLHVDGVPDGVDAPDDIKRSNVLPAGGIDPLVEAAEWPVPPVPSDNNLENDALTPSFAFHKMTDEEVIEAAARLGAPIQGSTLPTTGNGDTPAPATEAPVSAPVAPAETTSTGENLEVSSGRPKRRRVTSRRLHAWREGLSNTLLIAGALAFGENVTNSSVSYRGISLKIGFLRSDLCKGVAVTDTQVEEVHNSISSATDLTATEKRKLYKKLKRLDNAVERFNKRQSSSSSRRRGR